MRELKLEIERSGGPLASEQTLLLAGEALADERVVVGAGGLSGSVKLTVTFEPSFELVPVVATTSSICGCFEEYIARINKTLAATASGWNELKQVVEDESPSALEWFWLVRGVDASSSSTSANNADGLAVFRVKQMATASIGELMHLSVIDSSTLQHALDAIKARMFALLPIASIRVTLWYVNDGEKPCVDKAINATFKERRFRWFQLSNSGGKRAQIMECRRAVLPEGESPDPDIKYDPPKPADPPCILACLGQVWLRSSNKTGRTEATVCTRAVADNLIVAGACLRYLCRKNDESQSVASTALKEALAAARGDLTKGLLSGELDRLLAQCVSLPIKEALELSADAKDAPAALSKYLLQSLLAGGSSCSVPGFLCDGSADVVDLIKRGCAHAGYAAALSGLGLEAVSALACAVSSQDAAFGRLFFTLSWQSVMAVDHESFEVPVLRLGSCEGHAHPVFYVATSEDDTFVAIIPWEGVACPSPDAVFTSCTNILRTASPAETPPHAALRLPRVDARHATQTCKIACVASLGIADADTALHLAELSSLMLSPGREMSGRLRRPRAVVRQAAFVVKRPFAFCLGHTDLDDLNVPLIATLVK